MSKKRETPEQDLVDLLAKTRKVTKNELEELGSAIRALHDDPAHIADYFKGLFVEDVRRVLEEEGISQNSLAERIGKSRQYLSKILNQDQRVNFTIETMVLISAALGRAMTIRLAPPAERQIVYKDSPQRLRAVAEKRSSYGKKRHA